MRKLLKIRNVLERIPVSRAHIYNLMRAGKFPRQVKLGGTGSFWVEAEVEDWIQGTSTLLMIESVFDSPAKASARPPRYCR